MAATADQRGRGPARRVSKRGIVEGRPPKTEAEKKATRDARQRRTAAERDAHKRAMRALADKARAHARAKALEEASSAPPKKTAKGPAPFRPTPENRATVETLAGLGMRHDEIAVLIENPRTGKSIDETTLRAHFADELLAGPVKTNSRVAQSLFKKATGDGNQAVTAAIWWTKTRMGWREHIVAEVEVKSGVLVAPATASPEAWIAAAAAANALKTEPGKEEGDGG